MHLRCLSVSCENNMRLELVANRAKSQTKALPSNKFLIRPGSTRCYSDCRIQRVVRASSLLWCTQLTTMTRSRAAAPAVSLLT